MRDDKQQSMRGLWLGDKEFAMEHAWSTKFFPTLAPVATHHWAKTRCKKKKNEVHTERSKTSAQGESPRWELAVVAQVAVSHFTCSPWNKQQNAN
jgi:hypothetical protein